MYNYFTASQICSFLIKLNCSRDAYVESDLQLFRFCNLLDIPMFNFWRVSLQIFDSQLIMKFFSQAEIQYLGIQLELL